MIVKQISSRLNPVPCVLNTYFCNMIANDCNMIAILLLHILDNMLSNFEINQISTGLLHQLRN